MSDSAPVVVIGSGPAGLAAAAALSRSGLPVRLIERSDLVGGKVNSHHEAGRSLEHGVHGWWANYINFDRLLRWSNTDPAAALQEAESSELVLPDGRRYRLKLLSWNLPSPFFFILQILKAPYLTFLDLIRVLPFAIHALAFRHEFDYESYDGFTFQQLMDYMGVSSRVQRLLFDIFILSFDFTTPDRVSAACGLSGLQFYALRDQQSILPRWAKRLPADAVFGPIVAQLEVQGVQVSMPTSLESIVIENGRVTGVNLSALKPAVSATSAISAATVTSSATTASSSGDSAQPASQEVVLGRVALSAIPASGFTEVQLSPGTAWVGNDNGSLSALNARCTHEGCTIDWRPDQGSFVCPCHGGQFDRQGAVVLGPPQQPLQKLVCRVNGSSVDILGEAGPPPLVCSDVILATDLESAQGIVAQTDNLPTELRHNIGHLDTTPVIVVRIWFDPHTCAEPLQSAFTPGFPFVDNFFFVNGFDRDIAQEGHVIEVQAYRAGRYLNANDETILTVALGDLAVINAAYIRQNVLYFTVNRHAALFTHYGPGQNQFRPTEATGVDGLYLAGDWTKAPWSVWMMERGIISGLRAANAALRRRSLPEVEILRLPQENVVLRIARSLALLFRLFVLRGLPLGSAPTADELAAHHERDSRVLGWTAFYLAACNFLPLFAPDFGLMRRIWQVPVLVLGGAVLLHTEPDVQFQYGNWLKSWTDRPTRQRRLVTIMVMVGVVCELLCAFRGEQSPWIRSAFPLAVAAVGIAFLSREGGLAAFVTRQHQIIALVVVLTGLMWLGERLLIPLAPLSFAWPLTCGLVAYLLVTYTEHVLPIATDDHSGHDHAG